MDKIINAAFFQAGWFICIICSGYCLLITVLILLVHFYKVEEKGKEILFVTCAAIIGFGMDMLAYRSGILGFSEPGFPLFLLCIWFLFATTLGHSMKGLMTSKWAVPAAALVPVSYLAGQSFGKIYYNMPNVINIILHCFMWAFYLLLIKLYFKSSTHQRIEV